jgi:hypothetical protein
MAGIITYGDWMVSKKGLKCISSGYEIDKGMLWDSKQHENIGPMVWEWPIHLIDKGYLNSENANDFNASFVFAQDYFRNEMPEEAVVYVSLAQTLYVQDQILKIIDIVEKEFPEIIKDGFKVVFNSDKMNRYSELMSNIKYLPQSSN